MKQPAAMFVIPVLLLVSAAFASADIEPRSCSCAFGSIPVPVDVEIPINPAGGLNTTDLRRLKTVYNIFGEFCQPADNSTEERVQLLLHGSSYTHQYWTFPMNGFQNYSYVAHACSQGQTTFAYDQLGVGLSDRPPNSTDVQLPVTAQIANSLAKALKDGTLSSALGLGNRQFKKVIALGHSLGSVVFNYIAVAQPNTSSIDAMVLTGDIHDQAFLSTFLTTPQTPAREVNPARWGNLDPGYITAANRSTYYPPDAAAFSQDVLMLDALTLDVSAVWLTDQIPSVYVPARGYTGPVVEMVGALDQLHCFNAASNFTPCDAETLQSTERPFFPDAQKFTVIVEEGAGHDLNLDFGAAEAFRIYSSLVQSLV